LGTLKMNELAEYGQSIWLDYIDRPLLETGKLASMIDDGLRGMTSNPSIFNNAIGSSTDYDEKIRELKNSGKSTFEIYDELTIKDIQDAADHFKKVYEETDGLDGYVSHEIDPQIANNIEEQITEGKRLHKEVNRPNVMIKVPSTEAGIPVIEELIASGICVNATLMFSVGQFEQVSGAYYKGLARRAENGSDISKVHSVASVFVSRIDSAADKIIDKQIATETIEPNIELLESLKGKAAVANSRAVYEKWKELSQSDMAKALAQKGANIQRVLWASTGTKNADYSDIKYVSELICAQTVNTLPEKTLNAFLDHGEVVGAFDGNYEDPYKIIQALYDFDVDINSVCSELLDKGVTAFKDAFVELSASIEKKASELSSVK